MNYNKQVEYEEISAHNDAFLMEWTDCPDKNKVHVGSAALHLNPNLNYRLWWPIQRGSLNSAEYSHVRQVFDDLELLWKGSIVSELSIKPDEFKNYSVVLVVSDSFSRVEIKGFIDVLLGGQWPFRAVSVIQEGQAVTFGSGVSSALVVDCGAQKISVSCVEEGFLVPESRIRMPYGGDQITKLLAELLKYHEFPYEFDLSNPLDWELMNELKERCCTVNEGAIASTASIFEFYVRHPAEITKKYLFKMFQERLLAPLAMFEEEVPLLNQNQTQNEAELCIDSFELNDPFECEEDVSNNINSNSNTTGAHAASNSPNDLKMSETLKEEIIAQEDQSVHCRWGKCKVKLENVSSVFEHLQSEHFNSSSSYVSHCEYSKCKFESNDQISMACHVISYHFTSTDNNNNNPNTSTSTSMSSAEFITKLPETPVVFMSIDDAIISSLLQLGDSDRIKRCASSIILSGGSHLFSGFLDVLTHSLKGKFLLNPQTSLIDPKIFPNTRDLDARFLAWKGGAVFSKLESTATESWISCEDWHMFGMKILKEKVAFLNVSI